MTSKLLLGKSTELLITSILLDYEREVYLPAVDDHGVDLLVRTRHVMQTERNRPENFEFQELQVKSVSSGGLFAALKCEHPRPNYWFVFFIKDINRIWLVNSMDLVNEASRNISGKNIGLYTYDLKPSGRTPVKHPEHLTTDFSQLP